MLHAIWYLLINDTAPAWRSDPVNSYRCKLIETIVYGYFVDFDAQKLPCCDHVNYMIKGRCVLIVSESAVVLVPQIKDRNNQKCLIKLIMLIFKVIKFTRGYIEEPFTD